MKNTLIEIAGWYGALAIMAGYVLVSFSVVTAGSLPFQLLNLTGAMGLITIAAKKHDTQPVVLNIFWMLIAIVAIVRLTIR